MKHFVLFVLLAGVLLFGLGGSGCSVGAESHSSTKKPHVWLIIADDLGYADLGYTGSSIKTPVIDQLASEGMILGHYYVMQCCTPTRSALQTGRHPIRFGLQTQVISPQKAYGLNITEKLISQYMSELG